MLETRVAEIAANLYRISTYIAKVDLQFNQFLVLDDEPLLYHTGMRRMFPHVRKAVAGVMDPSRLRWIGFSHFEADECGSLNEWLDLAPHAVPICGIIGAAVNINDFADRTPRVLANGDILPTGSYLFRFLETPQVPHAWDASLLFEETGKTLFCSDLFLQNGDREPLTGADLTERARQTLVAYQAGPLADSIPYTSLTDATLDRLVEIRPERLAVMHGSSFSGDGGHALRELANMFKATLGGRPG